MTRESQKVQFSVAGTTLSGRLYRPDDGGASVPGIVLCTGFGGTQDTPSLVAAASAFAAHGWAALTFDYRNFGHSDGEPRQHVSIDGQLRDIRAAVAELRRQLGVDPARIALWGSSLGGGHVVTVGAEDPAIVAVIAQVPYNGFPRKIEGRPGRLQRAILAAMVKDVLRAVFRMQPHYIKAVGRSDELAVMPSDEALQTIKDMTSETWENRVAPRGLWAMARYRPGHHAPRLQAPLLVCIGERDQETQGPQTRALADAAPRSELLSYPVSHFQIYAPEVRERVLADQVAFLDRALTASPG